MEFILSKGKLLSFYSKYSLKIKTVQHFQNRNKSCLIMYLFLSFKQDFEKNSLIYLLKDKPNIKIYREKIRPIRLHFFRHFKKIVLENWSFILE